MKVTTEKNEAVLNGDKKINLTTHYLNENSNPRSSVSQTSANPSELMMQLSIFMDGPG